MSGSGFKNVRDGVVHFFQHILGQVDESVEAAAGILESSIEAVASEIKTHGADVVKAAAAAAAAAASQAKAEGKTNSEAGQAALSAAEKTALASAVTLGINALHAISTATVTGAAQ
ncbi:hypothetical protein [Roseicella sp. DB1501]|uniref:hypothetical protein n=1 Tax=Roseicella sp. DB1501 TaxID=2730925 RepID=UPI001492DED4|nr:hypothetical protein [Roseicella sp. DB1501]NOG70511.1 hypothetical protein [Roseicella sp. DB1501]